MKLETAFTQFGTSAYVSDYVCVCVCVIVDAYVHVYACQPLRAVWNAGIR